MKIYTAHRFPAAPREHARFVKDGFSWPAFFFPVIWLVIKRLWLPLALYVLALTLIFVAASRLQLAGGAVVAVAIGVNLILAFEANNLYRRALLRRGMFDDGYFVGEDSDEAALKYFQLQQSRADESAPILRPSL
jgi:hypothetical protein